MDRLRAMFASIMGSLGALGATQRLLVLAVVAVIGLTLVLTALLSARPTMVPLLPGVSAARQTEAQALLDGMNETSEFKGGQVYVPESAAPRLRGMLGDRGLLADEALVLFSNLASRQHWMNSREDNNKQFNLALQNELAAVISRFKGVKSAMVTLEVPEPVGFGVNYRRPKAQVTVATTAPLDQNKVDAIANMVAGARAGLNVADVTVIDTTAGRHYKPRGDDGMAASDALDHTSKVEARVQGKISEALRYIPGVIVAVNAHVDTRKTMTSTSTVLPVGEGTVSTISRDTSDSTESSQPRAPGGAPGVRANVADDINNGAGGGGGKNTTERTESEFKVLPGTRKQDVVDARGLPTRVSVTVNVPQEYLVAMVRAGKPDADRKAEVARADLDAAFATEKDRLTKDLQPLVESAIAGSDPTGAFTTVAGTVQVSMIPVPLADWGPGAAGAGSGGAQAGASLGSLEGLMGSGLVRQGVLAVFAVGALGMMFLMVRKSAKPATLPTAQEIVGVPPPLEAQNDLVGEADESQTAIEGIELGDAELKSKKMLEQVSDLVKNNPADAANLLNRWIQTES